MKVSYWILTFVHFPVIQNNLHHKLCTSIHNQFEAYHLTPDPSEADYENDWQISITHFCMSDEGKVTVAVTIIRLPKVVY